MANEKEFTGVVSAITAPVKIDNDGIVYVLFNLIEAEPAAPEVPYVLYIDTTKPLALKNTRRVAIAFITGRRIRIGLEPKRKSRVEWVKKSG